MSAYQLWRMRVVFSAYAICAGATGLVAGAFGLWPLEAGIVAAVSGIVATAIAEPWDKPQRSRT